MKNYLIIFQWVNYFSTSGVFTLIASENKKATESLGGFSFIRASGLFCIL